MPHFIIDCSANLLRRHSEHKILHELHRVAVNTGLFEEKNIKLRLRSFSTFTTGGGSADFIHVFGHIMEGRTIEQRADLSRRFVKKLYALFEHAPVISMNVVEFEKATYCNKAILEASS